MSPLSVRLSGPLMALASVLIGPHAVAANNPQDAAAAETLFREAKRLMEEENYEAACPKLEASQRLDPALGTLLNLAACHENEGKLASAWAEFLSAAHQAKQAGREEAENVARERAQGLEGRLTKLTIVLTEGARVDGLVVKRNGQKIELSSLGVATPIDAGVITVEVSAPGFHSWSGEVEAGAEGEEFHLEIPALKELPPAPVAPVPEPETTEEEPKTKVASTSTIAPDSSQRQTLGWVGVGLGAVGVGIGSAFGLVAMDRWDTAGCSDGACPDDTAQSHADDARNFATASTVSFIAGGVLAAAGVTLLLTSPKSTESAKRKGNRTIATRVTPSGLTLSVTQQF